MVQFSELYRLMNTKNDGCDDDDDEASTRSPFERAMNAYYGSVHTDEGAGETPQESDGKTVSWETNDQIAVDLETGEALYDQDPSYKDPYNDFPPLHVDSEDLSQASALSSSSQGPEQQLPGLTAAFQSLENRPILINCAWYLAIYFTVALVAYSFIFEKWPIIDSLYFAVSTFTTCGYGDHEPTTTAGQIFTIIFAIYGVIILGVFIGIWGNVISQAQTKAMKKFQKKKQRQILNTLFPESQNNSESSERHENGESSDNKENIPRQDNGKGNHSTGKKKKKSPPPVEKTGFWRDHISLADDIWSVIRAEFLSIALVGVLALVLGLREGWGVTSTVYFSIMAATTTGYGDYTPNNQLDKLYCVLFLPLAVAVFGEVLGRIATVYVQRQQRIAEDKFLHRSMTLCDIRNMDSDGDGAVNRFDFVMFMLVALQKVDKGTIEELSDIFDSLDRNGNGTLEEEDLMELVEENYLPTVKRVQQHKRKMSMTAAEFSGIQLFLGGERDPTPAPATTQQPSNKHRRAHTVT